MQRFLYIEINIQRLCYIKRQVSKIALSKKTECKESFFYKERIQRLCYLERQVMKIVLSKKTG